MSANAPSPGAAEAADERGALGPELTRLRERLGRELAAGTPAWETTARFSDAVGEAVASRARVAFARQLESASVAVVAVGGLGRREQFPFSDVDLVVLSSDPADELEEPMRAFLHPLWDAGLRVAAPVHSPESWMEEAEGDLSSCTALLDMRSLIGAAALVDALRQAAEERFFGDARAEFLRRINAEARARHERYGGTVYRVEPDLKFGPGGTRDIAAVEWALLATYGSSDISWLVEAGHVHEGLAARLRAARDVIVRLRSALHLVAGRAQDRLVFRYQEAMPELLGAVPPGADDASLVAAIEAFMQEYYTAARDFGTHGTRVFARCFPPRDEVLEERRIDERFFVRGDRLHHFGADPFAGNPVLGLDAIEVAHRVPARLSARTADCIAASFVADTSGRLSHDPAAQRAFMSLLVDEGEGAGPTALATAFELGVIERVIPEFEASRGRMQHDTFHVYTVDQHSLYAVEFLKAVGRGDHRKDYPLATVVLLSLRDPAPLYLATLLHDVGKPFGDQCAEGARIVAEAARRAGLDDAIAERLALLVREHLTMPLLSQKRDLGDPLLIAEFADRIGGRRALDELYLLSLADMATVSPGFLTSWKLALLDELYLSAAAHLRRGRPRVRLPDRPDEPRGLPGRYYSLFDVELRRRHLELARAVSRDRPVVVDASEGAGAVRLTVAATDRPGLLADIAATFVELSLDVVAADVFSIPAETATGSGDVPPGEGHPPQPSRRAEAVALDVFRLRVAEAGGHSNLSAAVESRLTDRLARRDAGSLDSWRVLEGGAGLGRRRIKIEPRVRFSVDPSGARSIVEVEADQHPGALAAVTGAFAQCGVEIQLARLLSEPRRVIDVFYVARLNSEAAERLRARILDALQPRPR